MTFQKTETSAEEERQREEEKKASQRRQQISFGNGVSEKNVVTIVLKYSHKKKRNL